jgi:hypothetical protein
MTERNNYHYERNRARTNINAHILRGNALDLVDDGDEERNSLLHLAVKYDLKEETKRLIGAGASLRIKNRAGLTPRHLALRLGNQVLLKIFARRHAYKRYNERKYGDSYVRPTQYSLSTTASELSSHHSTVSSADDEGMSILMDNRFNKFSCSWDVNPNIIHEGYMDWTEEMHCKHLRALMVSIMRKESALQDHLQVLKLTKNDTKKILAGDVFKELRVKEHSLCLRIWNSIIVERESRIALESISEKVLHMKEALEVAREKILWKDSAYLSWWNGFVFQRWKRVRLELSGEMLRIIDVRKSDRHPEKLDGIDVDTIPLDELCHIDIAREPRTLPVHGCNDTKNGEYKDICLYSRDNTKANSSSSDTSSIPMKTVYLTIPHVENSDDGDGDESDTRSSFLDNYNTPQIKV